MILADELKTDPLGLGYAAHLPGDPQRVVDLLTAQTQTMVQALRSTTAKAWAAAGPYAAIVDASNNAAHPCRASCLVIRDSFACGDPIHMEDPDVQVMFEGWITAGLITEAEHDSLYAKATVPASRVEVLGIPAPSARDILDAWEA